MRINRGKKNLGQGIVSVIVASGVGAVVLGFLTDMLVQQGISQKFLTQKLEMNDLSANLITTFSREQNCSCQFANSAATNPNHSNYASLKFDITAPIASRVIDVKKVYAGCKAGSVMPLLIAEEGMPLPNSSSLRVSKVEFVDLEPTGGEPNEWQGKWRISFQVGSGSVVRSVRPVQVTQKVMVLPDGANTTISSCKGLTTGSGTQNFLAKWSPISGVLENTTVFEDNTTGNLGIGTNSPDSRLHLKQTVDTEFGGLQITNSAGGPTSGANTSIYLDAANKTHIGGTYTSPSALTIDNATGRIGMGTSAPTASLQIDSSSTFPVVKVAGYGGSGGVMYGPHLIGEYSRGSSSVPNYPQNNDFLLVLRGQNKDTGNSGSAQIVLSASENHSATGAGGNIRFFTTANGQTGNSGVEQMRIENNGNIGIGTSSPTLARLHLHDPAPANLWGANSSGAALVMTNANTGSNYATQGSYVGIGGSDYLFVAQRENKPLQLWTNNTPRVHIEGNGNVGIGTVNPTAKLEVDGDIRAPQAQSLVIRKRFSFPIVSSTVTCPAAPTDFATHRVCIAAYDRKCGDLGYLGGTSIDWDSLALEGFCFRKGATYANE